MEIKELNRIIDIYTNILHYILIYEHCHKEKKRKFVNCMS